MTKGQQILYRLAADVLKRERKKHGLTQADIAKKIGTLQPAISKIETGTSTIDIFDFVMYSMALDIDPGEMLDEVVTKIENFAVEAGLLEPF